MLNTRIAAAAAGLVTVAVCTTAAHADLKVVQKTTIKNPQLTAMIQSMSPAMRAQMAASGAGTFLSGAPVTSVIYTHGNETRVDIGPESVIVDASTHKMIQLDRTAHTYMLSALNPASKTQIQTTVHATRQTKKILGYVAHRYLVSLSNAQMQGGKMTGDIWAAPALPQPPAAIFSSGPASALEGGIKKIKGLPLLVSMQVTGTSIGSTSVRAVTTSISRAPLPLSVFKVPAGYQQVTSMPANSMSGGLP